MDYPLADFVTDFEAANLSTVDLLEITSSGGLIASPELLATIHGLTCGPEELEGFSEHRDVAYLAKALRTEMDKSSPD